MESNSTIESDTKKVPNDLYDDDPTHPSAHINPPPPSTFSHYTPSHLQSLSNLILRSPLSLGLETFDDTFSVVIPRGSLLPITATQYFTTYKDYQTCVEIKVYQGERSQIRFNTLLGRFELTGMKMGIRAGIPKIEVTFSLDAQGSLSVHASELIDQQLHTLTVHHQFEMPSKYWHPHFVERILQDSQQNRLQDMKHMEDMDARLRLEQYCYGLRISLEDELSMSSQRPCRLTLQEQRSIRSIYETGLEWLNSMTRRDTSVTAAEFRQKLCEIQGVCQPVLRKLYVQPTMQEETTRTHQTPTQAIIIDTIDGDATITRANTLISSQHPTSRVDSSLTLPSLSSQVEPSWLTLLRNDSTGQQPQHVSNDLNLVPTTSTTSSNLLISTSSIASSTSEIESKQ